LETVPRKTKFQVKREATHQALLDAGMLAFLERGYATTRVEDIAERTGQTKGAFYFHFKNKLDLLEQVIRYRVELRGDWPHLPEGMDRSLPVEEVIRRTMAEVGRRLKGASGWPLVMVDAFRQHQLDPEVRARFAADYQSWIDEATELVDVLKACGWTASTVPSRELATTLFALGEGFLVHATVYGLTDDGPLYRAYAKILA
jgi:AcrR family transcriptional regulator